VEKSLPAEFRVARRSLEKGVSCPQDRQCASVRFNLDVRPAGSSYSSSPVSGSMSRALSLPADSLTCPQFIETTVAPRKARVSIEGGVDRWGVNRGGTRGGGATSSLFHTNPPPAQKLKVQRSIDRRPAIRHRSNSCESSYSETAWPRGTVSFQLPSAVISTVDHPLRSASLDYSSRKSQLMRRSLQLRRQTFDSAVRLSQFQSEEHAEAVRKKSPIYLARRSHS
jgi:hypothetical protein